MSEPLGVTPSGVRKVAKDLGDGGTHEDNVRTKLQGNLDAEGPAWGNDKMGHAFADGPNGYSALRDFVMQAMSGQAKFLNDTSEGLKTAADGLEQLDQP